MRSALFYIGNVCANSVSEYIRINEGLPKNFSLYWVINESTYNQRVKKIQNKYNITFILYSESSVNTLGYFPDKYSIIYNILIDNPEAYQKFDYYYIMEADCYFKGEYSEFFEELETSKADLLCSYIKKVKPNEWMWVDKYIKDNNKFDQNIKTYLKSCLYFFRLSNKAIKHIINYNSSNIKDTINELYIPTLLYNYNFSVKSLSSVKAEDDKEFFEFKYTFPEIFYCDKEFTLDDINSLSEIYADNILYYKYLYNKNDKIITNNKIYIKGTGIKNPLISVIMPVYNAYNYLHESIESILRNNFTKFEFIIINDGSDDGSEKIIEEYLEKDIRIKYINKKHSGLVNTLNVGIRNAKGKYLLRMDADDIATNDRLEVQYNYMESHKDVDICGGSMYWLRDMDHPLILNNPNITIEQLLVGNQLCHPTVIMRKSSIDKLPFVYESYYTHAEDYKLWFTALSRGLKLATIPNLVLKYRQSDSQVTSKHYDKMMETTRRIQHIYEQREIDEFKPYLTAIITFKNEGEEIEKTVASIRATTSNLRILLIDDASEDGYDYDFVATYYNCDIIHNKESKGVAGARDQAVENIQTPYFILFDGHMRFYDDDWDEMLVNDISKHPNCLLFTQTISIEKFTNLYENEDGHSKSINFGAYVNMDERGWQYTAKWTHRPYNDDRNKRLIQVPCCLGATYCASKQHWYNIGGLKGLNTYGQDEPYMSIKTWLAGGDILLYHDLYIGHIYREKQPYPVPGFKLYSNSILLNHFFAESEEKIKQYDEELRERIGNDCFNKSMDIFKSYTWFDKYKEYFYKNVAKRNIVDYYKFNKLCYY